MKKVIHKYDRKTLKHAPDYVKEQYKKENKDGAICGMVGFVTFSDNKVTCKNCLRKLK